MRRRFLLFVLLIPLAILATSQAVRAAGTSPATQTATSASCGTTTAEQIAAARKALAASDAKSERAALACLIGATAALNERVRALDAGRSPSDMLHVTPMAATPESAGR